MVTPLDIGVGLVGESKRDFILFIKYISVLFELSYKNIHLLLVKKVIRN